MIPNCKRIEDTGWIDMILTSSFKVYNDNEIYRPRCRKFGNLVEIKGVITPKKTINSNSSVNVFTLPERFQARYEPSSIMSE